MRRYEKLDASWFDAALYEAAEWREAYPDSEKIRCLDLVVMLAENKKRKLVKKTSFAPKRAPQNDRCVASCIQTAMDKYLIFDPTLPATSSITVDSFRKRLYPILKENGLRYTTRQEVVENLENMGITIRLAHKRDVMVGWKLRPSFNEDNNLKSFFECVSVTEVARSEKSPAPEENHIPMNMTPDFYAMLADIDNMEPQKAKTKNQKRQPDPNLLNSRELHNIIIDENKRLGNPMKIVPTILWLRKFASNIIGVSKQKRKASLDNYDIKKERHRNFNNSFVPGESLVIYTGDFHNKFMWNRKCIEGFLNVFFHKTPQNEIYAFGFDQKKAEEMREISNTAWKKKNHWYSMENNNN